MGRLTLFASMLALICSSRAAIAAPCPGTPASYGMTLGALRARAAHSPITTRSLEAIMVLSLSKKERKPIGWMAIDEHGMAWVSLRATAPKWVMARFHTAPPRPGSAMFTPWTNSADLPKGLFELSCSN